MIVMVCFSLLGVAIAWYYLRHKHDIPTLHYVNSDLNRHIIRKKARFTSPYKMPFWLQNTHFHTLFSYLLKHPIVKMEREYITMKDGGTFALDWVSDNVHTLTSTSPIMIISMMWTAHSKRSMGLCREAIDRGFRVVIYIKRGYAGTELTTPKLLSVADISDYKHALELIRRKYPNAHLFGHGSSAGCGTLVSYISKSKETSLLSAAVFASPSYNVRRTYSDMSYVYRSFLLSALKKVIWIHRKMLATVVDIQTVMKTSTIEDLNEAVYCKIYDYTDVDKFADEHDPLRTVHEITTPCLSISSEDDRICQTNTTSYHLFSDDAYPHRILVTLPKGGHCGFFEGKVNVKSWSDKLSLDYFEAVLEFLGDKSCINVLS